ncbi:MAG: efflux RND transporter permease subunit [Cyclobacteriaceae bacterium]
MNRKINLTVNLLSPILNKYIDWIASRTGKTICLTLFFIITVYFSWNLQFLAFDFEFENFFPGNDPDSQLYEIHKEEFGYDNDFLLLVINNEGKSIFDSSFLAGIRAFEISLKKVQDVDQVLSPVSQKHFINGPTGLLSFPLIHIDNPDQLQKDSIRIFSNPFYSSSFSSDKKSIGIYLTHTHFTDQKKSQELVSGIEKLAINYELHDIRLVGKLTAQNVFISFIQKDFGKFLGGSILLSFIILLLLFRNFKAALLPFLISLFSLIWLFGLMGALDIKITLLSSLLPPIMFFVSMSDSVHLMNAIHKSSQTDKAERIKSAIQIVWVPTLLTSVTTAVGFLSLIWINTQPIQSLGLFAAAGILIAFIVTFSIGLVLSWYLNPAGQRTLIQLPPAYLDFLIQYRLHILSVVIVMTLILIPGISRLQINAYLLDDLPENSRVRQDFEFTDQFLNGSKPYEIRIEAKDSLSVWDQEVMREIEKIEKYLLNEYPVGRLQSPSVLMKYLNMVNNGGLNAFYSLPGTKQDYNKNLTLSRRLNPETIRKLISEDGRSARIAGFFPELGSYETKVRNEKFMDYLGTNIDHSVINYRITGTTFLIDKSHELLSKNLIKGLLTAVLIIGIMLGIYFRSFKLLLISLIPNLVPLLIVAGVLGWMDISLKMTTSIIFTIAFGIAVDDTIHLMSHFLKYKTHDLRASLKKTLEHAGSAMLITSIIVIAGFSLFMLSDFGATFYLGLFVSLSLLVALIIDLTLLPLLLLFSKKKKDAE